MLVISYHLVSSAAHFLVSFIKSLFVKNLEYWHIKGSGQKPVERISLIKKDVALDDLVQQAGEGLSALIERFDDAATPYISQPRAEAKPAFSDYNHLARIKEWGIAGDAKAAKRTIEVKMGDDMRFTPDKIQLTEGDTIKFVFRNHGKVLHEFVLGTKKYLAGHAALMMKFPGMEHDEPYMAHVSPGNTGQIVWTFNRPGEFDFACLIPGHFQAGMVGKVRVTARRPEARAAM